jgi:hypothetical protein
MYFNITTIYVEVPRVVYSYHRKVWLFYTEIYFEEQRNLI